MLNVKNLYAYAVAVLSLFILQANVAYAAPTVAVSNNQSQVESQLTANRIEMGANGELLKSADKVAPGDVVEYRTRYINKGNSGVNGLNATLPIPVGASYLPDTAKATNSGGGTAQASLDGVSFAAIPLKRVVKAADGKEKQELVPYADYRAVRWNLGQLAAGKEMLVSLRVRINQTPAQTPVAALATKL